MRNRIYWRHYDKIRFGKQVPGPLERQQQQNKLSLCVQPVLSYVVNGSLSTPKSSNKALDKWSAVT